MDLDSVCSADEFYIFGAGVVGGLTYQYLKSSYEIMPKAFLVSEAGQQTKEYFGLDILCLDDIDDKNAVIVIALLPMSQHAIIKILTEKGFSNFIEISELVFQKMRNALVSHKNEFASQKIRFAELVNEDIEINANILVVSDFIIPDIVSWQDISVISTQGFLQNIDATADTIVLFLVNWDYGIENIITKACILGKKVLLSMRSRYMEEPYYDFVSNVKKMGFQISRIRRFFRPAWEYNTEDVLIVIEKRNVETLVRDQLCTGCGKCEVDCPQSAIKMKPDRFGNEKPYVDESKCVNCKKCIDDCPVYRNDDEFVDIEEQTECYAYMADDNTRYYSSSGGAFSVLAEELIKNDVVVFGAAWDADYSVKHVPIEEKKDLEKLRRSKYLKSDIREALKELHKCNIEGKRSAFFGCPCQIAAVKSYIGKETDNILFVDLICTQAPSYNIFLKYLKENYDISELKSIGFREKTEGWRADSFFLEFNNNTKLIKRFEDSYQKAYHSKLMMPVHCEYCSFSNVPRVGDITIGDFWNISAYDNSMDDGKGTSVILFNTNKGKSYYGMLEKCAKKIKEEPIEWVKKHNRIGNVIKPHMYRDRFYDEISEKKEFNNVVESCLEHKYDIGLVGNWSFPNYGTELSYYALYETLKENGYSVCLIEWPEDSPWSPYGCTQLFEIEPYGNVEIAERAKNFYEMRKYNDMSNCFIHGSDQLMSPLHYYTLQKSVTMSWVNPWKKKIAYAYSFGKNSVEYKTKDKQEIGAYLRMFDSVSVREESAVGLMSDMFSVDAEHVLEPVFLCDEGIYDRLSKPVYMKEEKINNYIFAYILDLNQEKVRKVETLAKELNMDLVIVSDAEITLGTSNLSNVELYSCVSLNRWLRLIKNCSYMITDSFHGTCMAVIFRKVFLSVVNRSRGAARFDSLANRLKIQSRLLDSFDDICIKNLKNSFEYELTEKELREQREKSIRWIVNSFEKDKVIKYTDGEIMLFDRCSRLETRLMELLNKE